MLSTQRWLSLPCGGDGGQQTNCHLHHLQAATAAAAATATATAPTSASAATTASFRYRYRYICSQQIQCWAALSPSVVSLWRKCGNCASAFAWCGRGRCLGHTPLPMADRSIDTHTHIYTRCVRLCACYSYSYAVRACNMPHVALCCIVVAAAAFAADLRSCRWRFE